MAEGSVCKPAMFVARMCAHHKFFCRVQYTLTFFLPLKNPGNSGWDLQNCVCMQRLRLQNREICQKFICKTHGPKTVKTSNLKCRLYWCLIEFIDWRHSQSCWYFRPLLWTSAPLTFLLVDLPPPPPPAILVWISTGVRIHTVCNRGVGEGIGGLRQINTCRQVPLLVNC